MLTKLKTNPDNLVINNNYILGGYMADTGLATFDTTVQETNEILAEIEKSLAGKAAANSPIRLSE